jgi:hypothetical protein
MVKILKSGTSEEAYRQALVRLNLDVLRLQRALDEATKVERPNWGHVGSAAESAARLVEALGHAEELSR